MQPSLTELNQTDMSSALLQALISLLDMYKVAQDSGVPRDTDIEAEFRAYHLCTIMAQHGKFAESRLQFYTSLQVRCMWFP